MSTGKEKSTEAVFNHHLQALLARDLDAIVEDYTEESVLIVNTAPELVRGLAAIRGFFAQLLEVFTPELIASIKLSRQTVEGEITYIVWSAGKVFPFVSDTFVIREGKTVVHTGAALSPQGG